MSLTAFHYCWFSLNVFTSAIELLHVSLCLPWLLDFYHCLYGPMELLHVSHCLPWLLAVTHCLSDPMELLYVSHCFSLLLALSHCLHGCSACLSLSFIVAGSLSLSLRSNGVPTYPLLLLAFFNSLSQFHGVDASLSLSLQFNAVATCLALSPMVDCGPFWYN